MHGYASICTYDSTDLTTEMDESLLPYIVIKPQKGTHTEEAHGVYQWYRICLQRRRPGFDPWDVKIPWRRARNSLQCSCLKSPMDRGAWQAAVHGVGESDTRSD